MNRTIRAAGDLGDRNGRRQKVYSNEHSNETSPLHSRPDSLLDYSLSSTMHPHLVRMGYLTINKTAIAALLS